MTTIVEINWWQILTGVLLTFLVVGYPLMYHWGTQNTGCSHASYIERPCPSCPDCIQESCPDCVCQECPSCPEAVVQIDKKGSCIGVGKPGDKNVNMTCDLI